MSRGRPSSGNRTKVELVWKLEGAFIEIWAVIKKKRLSRGSAWSADYWFSLRRKQKHKLNGSEEKSMSTSVTTSRTERFVLPVLALILSDGTRCCNTNSLMPVMAAGM